LRTPKLTRKKKKGVEWKEGGKGETPRKKVQKGFSPFRRGDVEKKKKRGGSFLITS